MLKVPKELPEWFTLASNKAMLTAKEVTELFNLPREGIYNEINAGRLPKGIVLKTKKQEMLACNTHRVPMQWSNKLSYKRWQSYMSLKIYKDPNHANGYV